MLTWTTIRRTISIGRLYLAIGVTVSLFLSLALLISAHRNTTFPSTFPLEIPLFAILGSMGGLMTFTSDRTKGVFEYLIAYGIRPRTLFLDGLIATVAMSTIILGLALAVGLGAAEVREVPLPDSMWTAIALYTVPMSYAPGRCSPRLLE